MSAAVNSLDDATLVRLDLVSNARALGMRCAARMLEDYVPPRPDELWELVAEDFTRCFGENLRRARACSKAARAMRTGDVEAAVRVLADHCGMSPSAWVEATREEQEAAR